MTVTFLSSAISSASRWRFSGEASSLSGIPKVIDTFFLYINDFSPPLGIPLIWGLRENEVSSGSVRFTVLVHFFRLGMVNKMGEVLLAYYGTSSAR